MQDDNDNQHMITKETCDSDVTALCNQFSNGQATWQKNAEKTHHIAAQNTSQNEINPTWLLQQILEDIRQVKFLPF